MKYTPATSALAISAYAADTTTINTRLAGTQQVYLPVESDSSSVQSTATSSHPFVVIDIRDGGPGIKAEDQARLFSKFMRLDNALNSRQRGAGLGLYLCRQLIEAMGGRIWVESTGVLGEGSTFSIALPTRSS